MRNTESLARQYDLHERAAMLGWPAHQIIVVDEDLGRSGATATGRKGFSELVADVGLGKAGIILGLEVLPAGPQQRRLVPATGSMRADRHPDRRRRRHLPSQGLQRPARPGAQGHYVRGRAAPDPLPADRGPRHKAASGDLRISLPAGLDYDDDGRVIITPDEAVAEAIATVFARFTEHGSARPGAGIAAR